MTSTLPSIINEYLLDLRVSKRAGGTIKGYRETLTTWARFLAARDRELRGVIGADCRAFMSETFDRGLAENTVAVIFQRLHAFYNWLEKQEYIDRGSNPWRKLARPKVTQRIKRALSDTEIAALLDHLDRSPDAFVSVRGTALILLLLDTGLRVSECLSILIGDLVPSDDGLSGSVKILGKGGIERRVIIGRSAWSALQEYLVARSIVCRMADGGGILIGAEDYLWLAQRGRWTPAGVHRFLSQLGDACGIPGVHPHRFRNTFCVWWLRAGGSERDGMTITGHKTRAIWTHYSRDGEFERAAQAHSLYSPADRLAAG